MFAFLGISTAFKLGGAAEESNDDDEDFHRPDDLLTQGLQDDFPPGTQDDSPKPDA